MRRRASLLLGLALLLSSLGRAGTGLTATSAITVELDPREIYLGQSLTLRVLVPGDTVAAVDLPGLADCTVIPRGRAIGTRGDTGETVAAYRFELVPRRAGELTVPALGVETGGARHMTAPVTFRVLPRPTPPSKLVGRDILLDAGASRTNPYVGEAVVYTLRLYRDVALSGISLTPPDFPGFEAVPLPGQDDGEIEVAGRRFAVAEVKYLVTPLRTGRVVLSPPTAVCRGVVEKNNAGPTKDLTIRGPELVLTARTLPPYDGTAAATGLIGNLELATRIEDAADRSGLKAVYVLTLSGRGNIRDFTAPALSLPTGLSARALPAEGSGGYGPTGYAGERIFRYELLAERPGDYVLPAVAWAVFDPEAGTYHTVAAPALTFRATATPAGDPSLAPPLSRVPDPAAGGLPSPPWRLALGLLPVAFYLVTYFRPWPYPERAGRSCESLPPPALAEALRSALDATADRSSPLFREGTTCLARLDRLLYAGEPADKATLAATAATARELLRRLA